jgi:hypothetical protein
MHKTHVQIIPAAKGGYSAKVRYFDYSIQKDSMLYVCSKVDPLAEGISWAEKEYSQDKTLFIIYGLGLGYHINALVELLTPNQSIIVLETCIELYTEIKLYDSSWLENLRQNTQVKYRISNDMNDFTEIFNKIQEENVSFSIYKPMIKLIPKSMYRLREVLEDYMVNIRSIGRDKDAIQENCRYNEMADYQLIDCFQKRYSDKPIVVVAAGPSLDSTIDILKEIQEEVYIFATGRALKALISKSIVVDLFCIIDAHYAGTYPQIQGVEDLNIPLIFLNSASYQTVEAYKGPKYMAYGSTQYIEKKYDIAQHLESNGSVATATIDLAIKFGGDPIMLLGQDLGYTNMKSHASDAGASHITQLPNMKQVQTKNGEYITTSLGLLNIKHGIEKKIAKHPNVSFINCTEGGAYINGCEHFPLQDVIVKLKEKKEARDNVKQ